MEERALFMVDDLLLLLLADLSLSLSIVVVYVFSVLFFTISLAVGKNCTLAGSVSGKITT